jgi:hypothetical protein
MAAVGDLVRCTNGAWMVKPPARGPSGHWPGPDRILVGHPPCSHRGGPTSRECNAVVYAPGATFRLPPTKNLSMLSVAVAALTFAAGCSTHCSAPQSLGRATRPLRTSYRMHSAAGARRAQPSWTAPAVLLR